jgi:hypothetical protein
MVYNIYLNSPQLAYEANKKKYYKYVIKNNNKIFNNKFGPYKPTYYVTSYKRIYSPNISNIPY